MMTAGTLDVSGLATSTSVSPRRALDRSGVYPDLLHMGRFKSASKHLYRKGIHACASRDDAVPQSRRSINLVAAIARKEEQSVDEIRRVNRRRPRSCRRSQGRGTH